MTSSLSKLARNGSHTSIASTSSSSSTDSSSHHHFLSHIRPLEDISSHFRDSWFHVRHRHEEIAAGQVKRGVAHLTREMMEMQIQHAPDVRGMMDCLPTRQLHTRQLHMDVGWRPKLGTWPLSKHEALMANNLYRNT